jgi:hypothetical protein
MEPNENAETPMDPELEELLKDPKFVESLEQMKRGEGRVIRPREFEDD